MLRIAGSCDDHRHQHGRQRPEDEQQDHERAQRSDHSLNQQAGTAARAIGARLVEREVAGDVHGDPGRQACRGRGPHLHGTALRGDGGRTGRIDLGEGGVPVARDVHRVPGREVRAYEGAGHGGGGSPRRALDRPALRRVTSRMEDDDVRCACAGAERVQRPLARLIGGAARDREALVPAVGDLSGSEGAEERENRPGADHGPAVAGLSDVRSGRAWDSPVGSRRNPSRGGSAAAPASASIPRRSSTRPKSRCTPTFDVDRAPWDESR